MADDAPHGTQSRAAEVHPGDLLYKGLDNFSHRIVKDPYLDRRYFLQAVCARLFKELEGQGFDHHQLQQVEEEEEEAPAASACGANGALFPHT